MLGGMNNEEKVWKDAFYSINGNVNNIYGSYYKRNSNYKTRGGRKK